MTVKDVNDALKIWDKNIAALKGKSTKSKPNTVTSDSVKIPLDLLKIHKEVFLTLGIFFVKNIPLFFSLSRKTVSLR